MNTKFIVSTFVCLMLLAGCSADNKFKGTAPKGAKAASGDSGAETKTTDEDKGGSDNKTTDGDTKSDDPKTTDEEILKSLPKFGMLVNHFECGFCHMKLIGDMASTATVPGARNDSEAIVEGDWLVRGELNVNENNAKVMVAGATKENYTGTDVPKSFPVIDMTSANGKAKGKLSGVDVKGSAVAVAKSYKGNVVLVGSADKPIVISGDVFIDGDVIIRGDYSGVGTIYASGSIYVPSDLKAKKPAFPFPADRSEAIAKAESMVKANANDGLGLAAGKSIFIGSLDVLKNIIFDAADPEKHRLDYEKMYAWFGEAEYSKLYIKDQGCEGRDIGKATLNVVDAFLYARQGISGLVLDSSFSIRGGMIAESFNLVNGVRQCIFSKGTNAVHGREKNNSYVEYDWRLYTGKFPILERLGEVMQQK